MDHDFRIQEQALTFLRNLACGKEESDIEQIFLGLGNDLVPHLEYFMLNDRYELVLQVPKIYWSHTVLDLPFFFSRALTKIHNLYLFRLSM